LVGQEEINYSPYQVPSDIGMLSFFSPRHTSAVSFLFSIKLTKSFFLDLRMFLKAVTLVASLDKGEKMEVQKDKVMWLQYGSMCCWR
jgi:hypothetical protein